MPVSLRDSIAQKEDLPRTDVVLMGRAELLAPADRDLLEAVLIRSQPVSALGRIMDVDARLLRLRIHRLGRRLASRRFLDAARALPYLDAEAARLARLHFCQKVSIIDLAAQEGLSRYTMRRHIERIAAQIQAVKHVNNLRSKAQ
jgi:hypothetical protein